MYVYVKIFATSSSLAKVVIISRVYISKAWRLFFTEITPPPLPPVTAATIASPFVSNSSPIPELDQKLISSYIIQLILRLQWDSQYQHKPIESWRRQFCFHFSFSTYYKCSFLDCIWGFGLGILNTYFKAKTSLVFWLTKHIFTLH